MLQRRLRPIIQVKPFIALILAHSFSFHSPIKSDEELFFFKKKKKKPEAVADDMMCSPPWKQSATLTAA